MKNKNLVFVYGTLLSGFGNNRILTKGGATLVGEARITGFELFDLGVGFPGIVRGTGIVRGEIWNVSDLVLTRLDQLEGVNQAKPLAGSYRREEISAELIGGAKVESVEVYIKNFSRLYKYSEQIVHEANGDGASWRFWVDRRE